MSDWTFESTLALDQSSTLEYLNSQLVSQGYVPAPGLSLQLLQGKDQERAIRCVLSLLSQRVDDLQRFEIAKSKIKTQSFELDRIQNMWREECEKSSNAEREMTLYKSKLTGAQKNVEELQKKCQLTLVDLSRTRSTLQSVRQGATMEIKRKEKEVEKIVDRFQKLAGGGTIRITGHGAVEEAIPLCVLNRDVKSLVEEELELAEEELGVLKSERERIHDVFTWVARELSALVADGTEVLYFFVCTRTFLILLLGKPEGMYS
jgi:myosin heavy subunit